MRVYGYTEDKDVVAVDLSIDKIVSAGLDPWRLDLFDSDPVMLTAGGQNLRFRKLQDIAFAYRLKDAKLIVGMHDGVQATCVYGDEEEVSLGLEVRLYGIKLSDRQFSQCFSEYLHALEQKQASEQRQLAAIESCLTREDYLQQIEIWKPPLRAALADRRPVGYSPRCAEAVSLEGSALTFEIDDSNSGRYPVLESGTFVGAMFDEIATPIELPDPINWVLGALAQFRPLVLHGPIRQSLAGKSIESLLLCVDTDMLFDIGSWLENKYGLDARVNAQSEELYFQHRDFTYCLQTEFCPRDISERFLNRSELFSPQWLYAAKPNQVMASRISLFDLSRKQARMLRPNCNTPVSPDQVASFAEDGLKLLQSSGAAAPDLESGKERK